MISCNRFSPLLGTSIALMAIVSPHAIVAAAEPTAAAAPELDEVSVTARALEVQTLIDRTVYTVTANLQATSGSAADILNVIPSVDVDADGNVSLRGDSSVTILVNGKPSGLLQGSTAGDGLLQLSASEIDKVEVMTNPPAQFKADAAGGVINIITKKTGKGGDSGAVQASIGDHSRYQLAANIAHSVGQLQLTAGVGLRQDDRRRIVQSDRLSLAPGSVTAVRSQQFLDESALRVSPVVKGGLEYHFNDRQSIEASLSHRERNGDRFFDQQNYTSTAAGLPISASNRHSDGREWSLGTDAAVNFAQVLRKPEETLEVSLNRAITRERERYAYVNTYWLPASSPGYDHLYLSLDLVTSKFGAAYSLALSDGQELKAGYDFQQENNAFDNSGDTVDNATGRLVVNTGITNDFLYLQKVHALYSSYRTHIGSWGMQAGLRIEQTRITTHQLTNDRYDSQQYSHPYPSLHLNRSLAGGASLSVSVAERISRPDPEDLNPFYDSQDVHNLRAGNPNLRPQNTRLFELGYSGDMQKQHYSVTGYLRRSRDGVTDLTQVVSPDVVLTTKVNLLSSTSGGLEFSTNGGIGDKLTYNVSANLFSTQIDAQSLGTVGLQSTRGLNAKARVDYRLSGSATAQVSMTRTDKRLTPQGFQDAINVANVGYKHQLRSDLSVVATVSDVFNSQVLRRTIATPTLAGTYSRQQQGRIAYIGAVYLIGNQKKSKATDFEYEP